MPPNLRTLKDRAVELMGKRRFDKAALAYTELCELDPADASLRQRLGDAQRAAGKKREAVEAYRAAAERYAKDGMLLKAIALCKLVLELEPSHTEMQNRLATLYAKRASAAARVVPAGEVGSGDVPGPSSEMASSSQEEALPEAAPIEEVVERTHAPAVQEDDEVIEVVFPEEREASAPEESTDEVAPAAPVLPSGPLLPATPLFEALESDAFVALLQGCLRRPFHAGDVLIRQGEAAASFFVIAEGRVRVVRELDDGSPGERTVELAVLAEGAFFGELALLTSAPRSASVIAITEGEALEFPSPMLEDLERDHPAVAAVLQRFTRARLLQNTMATSPLFRPFDWEHRKQLIERFKQRDVAAGETILREGAPGDGLYVVLQGRVRVEQAGSTLAQLREGSVFGEMSLLSHGAASATVIAEGAVKVLRLPRETFVELISTHPQALEVISELAEQRQQTNEALRSGAVVYDVEGLVLL